MVIEWFPGNHVAKVTKVTCAQDALLEAWAKHHWGINITKGTTRGKLRLGYD